MRASVERDDTTMMADTEHHQAPLLLPTDEHLRTQGSDRCPDLVGPLLSTEPTQQPAATRTQKFIQPLTNCLHFTGHLFTL